jgi:hypothetical protein
MSNISQENFDRLVDGFNEFYLHVIEALEGGWLEEALAIAEVAIAFIAKILDGDQYESSEDTNLFVFVDSPQRCSR